MTLIPIKIKNSLLWRLMPLLLILLLGSLLRLYALDADSLWGDEIFSYQRGTEPNRAESYKMLLEGNHPPLYELIILHEWLKVGQNEFFLRFPSAFFALLTISVVYLLAQAAFDRTTGLLSALLLALSPLHVYYSREARMYGLLAFLLTLALYFFYQAIKASNLPTLAQPTNPPSRIYRPISPWAPYVFLMACSLYTHYYSSFTLLSINAFMVAYLLIKFDWNLLKDWVASNIEIMLLFLPWLPTLFIQLNNDPVEWIQPISFKELLELPVYFFVRREVVPEAVWWLVGAAIWFVLIATFLRIIQTRRRDPKPLMSYLYLMSGLMGPLLIAYLVSFFRALIVTRYFMGIVPLTCILLAFGLRQLALQPIPFYPSLRGRLIAFPLMILIITTAFFSSLKITTSLWQEDWRGVTTYIEQHSQAGDSIILFFPVGLKFWRMPFKHYYHGELPISYVEGEIEPRVFEQKAQRIWLIQSARNTLSGPLPDTMTSPFANYRLIDRQTFNQALVPKEYTVDVLLLEQISEG